MKSIVLVELIEQSVKFFFRIRGMLKEIDKIRIGRKNSM